MELKRNFDMKFEEKKRKQIYEHQDINRVKEIHTFKLFELSARKIGHEYLSKSLLRM